MKKLLYIIDDEKNLADTLAAILRMHNYDVEVFYEASSVLERLQCNLPDLIISDVFMPGMTGVELAVIVRQNYPACKIILFSGNATTLDLLNPVRQQGFDFELLAKPLHPEDLLARISA